MAKKKAKISKSQGIDFLAILLGIAAICMIFVASVNYTGKTGFLDGSIAGTEVVFGKENTLGFSFMALLPYVLTLCGVALLVLKFFGILDLEFVAFAAFIVAAVFFFLTSSFVVVTNETLKAVVDNGFGEFGLAIGSILAGVFSALSGLSLLAKRFIK